MSDEPGIELDFWASFQATVASFGEELAAARHAREASIERQSERYISDQDIPFGGIVPASGVLLLPVGQAVPSGRKLEVRELVIGGGLVTDTLTGTAYFIKDSVLAQGGTPTVISMRDSVVLTSGVENRYYSSGQFVLLAGQQLYCWLTGGASGQNVSGSVYVRNFPDSFYPGSDDI